MLYEPFHTTISAVKNQLGGMWFVKIKKHLPNQKLLVEVLNFGFKIDLIVNENEIIKQTILR